LAITVAPPAGPVNKVTKKSGFATIPTPAQISTMYTMTPVKPKLERLRTRTWTNFKAGN
jgi:putrescine transport system substrate-binding protein